MTDPRPMECPCYGTNEHCFRCSGRGVITEEAIVAPERHAAIDLDDSPLALAAEIASHGTRYPIAVARPDPSASRKLPEVSHRGRAPMRQRSRANTPSFRSSSKTSAASQLATCPVCRNKMPATSIDKHMAKRHRHRSHPVTIISPAPVTTRSRVTVASAHATHPSHGARTERALDGSAGFHDFAREHGRYGSHPSFDGDD